VNVIGQQEPAERSWGQRRRWQRGRGAVRKMGAAW
jgi:hypothetical protein